MHSAIRINANGLYTIPLIYSWWWKQAKNHSNVPEVREDKDDS